MSKEETTIFHRTENFRTQSIRIAVKQNVSGELWGSGAFGGLPAALAHLGPIADKVEGTEFETSVPYAKNGDPAWAYWYLPKDGGNPHVGYRSDGNKDFACVKIEPRLNRYRCR